VDGDGHPYLQIHFVNAISATVSGTLLGIAQISAYFVKSSVIVRTYCFPCPKFCTDPKDTCVCVGLVHYTVAFIEVELPLGICCF
jgi:hypothetical protein